MTHPHLEVIIVITAQQEEAGQHIRYNMYVCGQHIRYNMYVDVY